MVTGNSFATYSLNVRQIAIKNIYDYDQDNKVQCNEYRVSVYYLESKRAHLWRAYHNLPLFLVVNEANKKNN